MMSELTAAHKELYHYTTAAGLEGIVKTQQLRATNISFLNDAEEHVGYFDRRLPLVIEKAARAAIKTVIDLPVGRARIKKLGGVEGAISEAKKLGPNIRNTTLEFNSPYIVSFCPKSKIPNNGLLSQWRGYGVDGSYAIVFDTGKLAELLHSEDSNFHYQMLYFGDVDYYDEDTPEKARHDETIEAEKRVEDSLRDFYLSGEQDAVEPLYKAVTLLSCSHKHEGFSEEKEVRIIAVPANDSVYKAGQTQGDVRPQKQIQFTLKNGALVPHLMLFEPMADAEKIALPIKKVIVGPHPDKRNRQKSVNSLLKTHGIDAEVVVSEIPYIGR
jgi:hypothetical protein